jgi:hypothetical protein
VRSAVLSLAVLAMALTAPALAEEAKQDFTLVNATGYELKAVYVSPSKAADWQDDILGQDTLGDGLAVHIHFSPKFHTCNWDLKVVYTDDSSSAVWSDINLCEIDKITIHYNRKEDTTSATFD